MHAGNPVNVPFWLPRCPYSFAVWPPWCFTFPPLPTPLFAFFPATRTPESKLAQPKLSVCCNLLEGRQDAPIRPSGCSRHWKDRSPYLVGLELK